MTTFDDRERGFEAKFAHDEEEEFKAHARRDRLVAEWAGARMGLKDRELGDYVTTIWREDLKHPGDEDVAQRIYADLHARDGAVTEAQVREQMELFLQQARTELAQG